ncbi:MAG: hypothetical protein Q8P41_10555 [Pseudomonadota bacterium]|nr:hypothetical protein [Pseudomonadota bacterium]
MISLLLLTACGGPPAEVPDKVNQITADVLPELVTIGSVDLPWLFWLTMVQLSSEDWRDCPSVFLREDGGTSVTGNDCVDSTGVQWFGTASLSIDPETGRQVIVMQGFGANDSVGGWMADGQVSVTPTLTGYLMDTAVSVASLANDESFVLWADTASAYATYGDVVYADRSDGQVGVEGWGTAELTARLVPVSLLNDCGWASAFSGRLAFDSSNAALVTFNEGGLPVGLPPPADTGATGDTGDTGADDTGLPDVDDSDEPDGVCGICRNASIDGTSLGECMDLERVLSWPFPAPF